MLRTELAGRKANNSYYSLRAFARDLEIEAPRLSMILSSKKGLSSDKAREISSKINWNEEERNLFVNLVGASHERSFDKRIECQNTVQEICSIKNISERKISEAQFRFISEWYFYALIELIKTHDFRSDINWISKRLKITEEEAQRALEILESLDLITISKKKIKISNYTLNVSSSVPSEALRTYYSQVIRKALSSVREQSIDDRILSALTIATPKKLIPEIHKKINEFRREMNVFISENSQEQADEVYILTTQFFKTTNEETV